MMGMPAVMSAIINNDLFGLQNVILDSPNIDLNQTVVGSSTALHITAEKGYSSCTQILISAGADVNVRDDCGITPLVAATLADNSLTVAKIIQAETCDYNLADNRGMTALHYAAEHGKQDIVELLLLAGADVNVINVSSQSPLNRAICMSHTDVVKTMVLGCTYTDVQVLASSPDCPTPLYKALCDCCFSIALWLLMGGYSGLTELHRFWRQFKVGRKPRLLAISEEKCFNYLTSSEFQIPPSLQHLTRLTIRKVMSRCIPVKTSLLDYPSYLKDYICFKDMC